MTAWAESAVPPVAPRATATAERDVNQWLLRMQNASRKRTYVGTFVVLSSAGSLYSSRIWHACDGEQQMERVESLTGAPRTTLRRNDQVITFLPEMRVARTEKRDSLGVFPNLQRAGDPGIAEFYQSQVQGVDRVAGFDADVVLIQPRDAARFGYRIWSEKKTGLVVKIQTLDGEGRVLEQAAFSELDLDAPVKMDKLAQMMANTAGYRVDKAELIKTTPQQEGWALKAAVPGFQPVSCYRRGGASAGLSNTVQWNFTDGLATVSLFLEPYDRQRHGQDSQMAMGATQTLARRLTGDWWLTAVGEVPLATLKAFAAGLERR